MKTKKRWLVIGIVTIVLLIAYLLIFNPFKTGKAVVSQGEIKTVPLSNEERIIVSQTLLSTEFIKSVPENSPIALSFYSFDNGERIWRDSFLIGKDELLSNGNPGVYLSMDSKYISELNGNNLCEIIQTANKNRDLGFYSEESNAVLLIKYAGLLKYRDCFGF